MALEVVVQTQQPQPLEQRLQPSLQWWSNLVLVVVDKPYHHLTTASRSDHLVQDMSRRNGPKLDLKLNLSPPIADRRVGSPSRTMTVSPTSPASSCVSSEDNICYSSSPEAASMMLVGCPNCLMYVMLSENDPRCPKCKSSVLLDVLHENAAFTNKNKNKNNKRRN